MRGTVPGLASPHPLGGTLPGLYADDSFAQRLCLGLDELLAPVLATLDCLPAYLDPGTAPSDLLDWLADWVGIAIPPDGPLPGRPEPGLVVRLRTADPRVDERRLAALIAPFAPAHVPWRLELLRG